MTKKIILPGLFISLMILQGCGKNSAREYKIAEPYRDFRQKVLTLNPAKTGPAPTASNRVWGVLMETGYPEAVATLVTLGDGTMSLCFSNGGGIMGAGQYIGPRKACEVFLACAPEYLVHAQPATECPLPRKGKTCFYFLTNDGVLEYEAKETDLGNNRLPLSPFFQKAHDVITQVKIADEAQKYKQTVQEKP